MQKYIHLIGNSIFRLKLKVIVNEHASLFSSYENQFYFLYLYTNSNKFCVVQEGITESVSNLFQNKYNKLM